jgi:hypothetical protein
MMAAIDPVKLWEEYRAETFDQMDVSEDTIEMCKLAFCAGLGEMLVSLDRYFGELSKEAADGMAKLTGCDEEERNGQGSHR